MFGFPILEVAIGLCFVYLLLSLICSAVNETVAALTQRRGKMLEQAINNLVGDLGFKNQIYAHPIIRSLAQPGKQLPSYIPSQKFALAVMDIVTKDKPANDSAALRQGVAAMPKVTDSQGNSKPSHLQGALSAVLNDSQTQLKTDQQKIQAWYDDAMDRVSGWYKRRTSAWIWGLALLITLCLNADTTRIAKTLWTNQAVRSAVVDAAKARAQSPEPLPLVNYPDPNKPGASTPASAPDALTPDEQAMLGQVMLGWEEDVKALQAAQGAAAASWWGLHLVGWLLTMVALSLGAPFWFDMLNKFMNIRNSGQAPPKAADTAAEAAKGAAA